MSGERTKEIQRHRLMLRTAWVPRDWCLISVHLKKRQMVNCGAGGRGRPFAKPLGILSPRRNTLAKVKCSSKHKRQQPWGCK